MSDHPIPLTGAEALDRYFLEMRGKVIEVAAALDRIERASGGEAALADYRIAALGKAIKELLSPEPGRAERVQLLLSDHSTEPIPAVGDPRAYGAPGPADARARGGRP